MYHIATKHHAIRMSNSAIGTSNSHFRAAFSVLVNFQIRDADPENDVGAEVITLSDANLFPIDCPFYILIVRL